MRKHKAPFTSKSISLLSFNLSTAMADHTTSTPRKQRSSVELEGPRFLFSYKTSAPEEELLIAVYMEIDGA
jgi:hypothetical protein